ncbi:MAG: creatininase family protein [Clostridia bacterium]|nr:creatininase family protein [Clostridia bacterium]
MAYFLNEMSVRDLKNTLTKCKTIIIPVAIVEQHGYHLPLTTDIHMAVQPLIQAGERLNAVVAPSVNYSFSGGELTGTININPNVFATYLTEICSEFIRTGFKNVVLFLGHGGTENTAAVKSAIQMLLRRDKKIAKEVTISIIDCFELSKTWLELFNQEPEHDFHAGQVETALMMHWRPDLVQDDVCIDDDYMAKMMRTDPDWFATSEKLIDHPFVVEAVSQRPEIEVGVMGFPELANPELGKIVADETVEELIKYIDMINEKNG